MLFTIASCAQRAQRYETVGDWYDTNLETMITATQLPTEDHTFLIAVHELIECYLCKKANVTQEQVDKWDETFEGFSGQEPGDHPKAPYRLQHQAAESIERHLAQILGVDWSLYQREIDRVLLEQPE